MAETRWINVSLRAYSEERSSDRLTALLGIAPTRVVAKGSKAEGSAARAPANGWFLDSNQLTRSGLLDAHLAVVLDPLTTDRDSIDASRVAGWRWELIVDWEAPSFAGPWIQPKRLRQLADLGIPVQFRLHSSDDVTAC